MENSQKMVIFKIVCCHSNSLQHSHTKEKEIPAVWLIFTVNTRSLPKAETNSSFLVLHPSSDVHTVNTVGSHLYSDKISNKRFRLTPLFQYISIAL